MSTAVIFESLHILTRMLFHPTRADFITKHVSLRNYHVTSASCMTSPEVRIFFTEKASGSIVGIFVRSPVLYIVFDAMYVDVVLCQRRVGHGLDSSTD